MRSARSRRPLRGQWSLSLFGAASAFGFLAGCATAPASSGNPETVDPLIYTRTNDPTDPFQYKYEEFRARRAGDMASGNSPRALERYAARHRTSAMPWGDLEKLLPFDWEALLDSSPDRAADLKASVRLRLAFDHPDLKISQLMIGAGGILPRHADGAPGAFVVIGGRGEITVEAQTERVTIGSTVKLEPYAVRSLRAGDGAPLRVVWIRWAPGGDQSYIDSGYYLTGANQHIQPQQAFFADGYLFWGEPDLAYGPNEADEGAPAPSAALTTARAEFAVQGALYPKVPVFGHESVIPWLSAETLKAGGFFFSDDLGSMLDVADQMIAIARHKAIFRASRPDGRWDFNFSQSAWGPRSTYVEHSHVIPEFYYVLSGPVIYGVDGDRHPSLPGDILFNNSYSPHLAQGMVDGLVFRSFSSTFAPNGDRSVFGRPYLLEAPLPEQPPGARLADDATFH